jgi:integrase
LPLVRRVSGRPGLTVHGFRSSFRDWAAERTNFSPEVAELALAHSVGSKVERAYRRSDLFERRRRLMAAWDQHCTGSETARVVAIGA